jgi:hypothetical protein
MVDRRATKSLTVLGWCGMVGSSTSMHFLNFLDRGWQVVHFTGIVWDIGDSLGSRWSKRDFTSTISYLRHSIYVAATNRRRAKMHTP